MHGFLFKWRVKDVKILFHWSILFFPIIAILFYSNTIFNFLTSLLGILIVVFMHEVGHFLAAILLKYDVSDIVVHVLGGYCIHEEPELEFEDILISLGGVSAQLVLILLSLSTIGFLKLINANLSAPFYLLLVRILIVYNLFLIIINLLPFEGFDGKTACRVVKYIKLPKVQFRLKKKKKQELTRQEAKKMTKKLIDEILHKSKDQEEDE